MLLAIDVGNTQTVIGLYGQEEGQPARGTGAERDLLDHWRIATNADRTSDEMALVVQEFLGFHGFSFDEDIEGVALCSSVPRITAAVRQMTQRYFGFSAVVVEPGIKTGHADPVRQPQGGRRRPHRQRRRARTTCTAGRRSSSTSARRPRWTWSPPRASTSAAPSCPASRSASTRCSAGPPRCGAVELVEPRSVIGKNTVESIQSGAVYGFAAQVDGLCARMAKELGEANVVATGGLAELITPLSTAIEHHEPWLTLHGLRLIFEKNRP